jgi:hypothetical protein
MSSEVVGTTLVASTVLSAVTLAAAIYLTTGIGSSEAHMALLPGRTISMGVERHD